MLVRLEEIKEEGTVEVDRSGTLVRIRPPQLAARVQQVLSQSGMKAELLDRRAAEAAVASATAWFSRSNIRELSREEFRILSHRWTAEIKETVTLSDDQQQRLVRSLERAFDNAVKLIPSEQGIPRNPAVWQGAKAQAVKQVLLDATGYLDSVQLQALQELLEAKVRK